MSRYRLVDIWKGIKRRCTNTKDKDYVNYGGRGITICKKWEDSCVGFVEWSLLNGYDDTLQIDRIDNSKGYSPDNCRWTTPQVNSLNRDNTIWIECFGEKKCLLEWSKDPRCTLTAGPLWIRYNKYKDKCTIEELLTTPPYKRINRVVKPAKQVHVPKTYSYAGKCMTLPKWANDSLCEVGYVALCRNVRNGLPFNIALLRQTKRIKMVSYAGKTMSLRQWSQDKLCEVSYLTLQKQLKQGMPIEKALCKHKRKGHGHGILTEDMALLILSYRYTNKITVPAIADMFKVSIKCIEGVIYGRSWRNMYDNFMSAKCNRHLTNATNLV